MAKPEPGYDHNEQLRPPAKEIVITHARDRSPSCVSLQLIKPSPAIPQRNPEPDRYAIRREAVFPTSHNATKIKHHAGGQMAIWSARQASEAGRPLGSTGG
jgi:hypothetical protein